MNYKTHAAILLLTAGACSLVAASEIYKWTDENGNVHYTDTPVGESSEIVPITSRRTDNVAVQQQTQARLARKAAAAEEAAEEAEAGPTPEEIAAQEQDRREKCAMYRERLTKFVQSRRLYRETENGNREYLDETQMQQARARVQAQVEEYCGS
jgi:hypothetical protein